MSDHPSVLGVHPFTRGFGWVLFAKPLTPADWSVVERKKDRNAQCLFALERVIERYQPDVIAFEAYDDIPVPRAERICRLYRSMTSLAQARAIEVVTYTRSDVRLAFAPAGAVSRYEIACAIAQHIDALRPRLPKKRALWEGEKPNMALFSAAAVALTHYWTSVNADHS